MRMLYTNKPPTCVYALVRGLIHTLIMVGVQLSSEHCKLTHIKVEKQKEMVKIS